MKIGILHHDLEWAETEIGRLLKKKGFEVVYVDIRNPYPEELFNCGCVLNRIYASVGNRDCKSNIKALELLKRLEEKNIFCLNSYVATSLDYSKYASSEIMNKNGIPNPKTIFVNSIEEDKSKILEFAYENGYPLVIKRDMGGRGKDVQKVDSEIELFSVLKKLFIEAEQYDKGFIVQKFLSNIRDYDCRIAIIDGEFAFSYKRSLICVKEDERPWLASVSRGSNIEHYDPSEDEIILAKNATKTIGAVFNEIDMAFCKQGAVIIENNPTPNYIEDKDSKIINNAVDLIEKKILEFNNEKIRNN